MTRTWMPTRSGWKTPIRMLGAPAGLVSGPRMLKMVRTPISRRTAATFFIAGWWLGANMKPTPVLRRLSATCSGSSMMLPPSASSTSAAPDFEDTPRLPCLATVAPAAAATKVAAVEMLKVWAPSPPVPTMSTKWGPPSNSTRRANSRMTEAAAVIWPMVSFLMRRPARIAAVMTGETSPDMIRRISESISSWKISRCSMHRTSASWGVIWIGALGTAGEVAGVLVDIARVRVCLVDRVCRGRSGGLSGALHGSLEEPAQHGVPMLRRDGLGMELHALDVELAMPYAHDLAVVGPGGELQAIRKVLAVDGERVVADHLECRRQALEKTDARMANRVGLAVHHTGGTYHPPAEGLPDRLVAKADAQDRAAPGEAVDGLERHAGLVGRAGPGRND